MIVFVILVSPTRNSKTPNIQTPLQPEREQHKQHQQTRDKQRIRCYRCIHIYIRMKQGFRCVRAFRVSRTTEHITQHNITQHIIYAGLMLLSEPIHNYVEIYIILYTFNFIYYYFKLFTLKLITIFYSCG